MTRPQSDRPVPELVRIKRLAEELADKRRERVTSVHLLGAIASSEAPASELLRERRLDVDVLLKASRSFDDDAPDAIARLFDAARDLAVRSAVREAGSLHLLLALLSDRSSAAHRSLVHAGVDLARLRTAAMQLALGVVAPRRAPVHAHRNITRGSTPKVDTLRKTRALATPVAVPLVPPAPARIEKAKSPPPSSPRAALPVPPPSAPRAIEPVALDPSRFPALSMIGKNLTLAAAEGRLEPVVGREVEIDRVLDVLAKRHANSACLVGRAGVGKTSVARGLAHRFAASRGADARTLVEIVVAELTAGAARGALADRWAAIRSEVRESKGKIVLFIDEIHELFGPGAIDEGLSELKLALSRGELAIVGATTTEEYRRSIESDTALARRFTVVDVEEPGEEDAFLLLQSVAGGLGEHHRVRFSDESIACAVSWSTRYLPGRALPDKAIAILDFSGARARRTATEGTKEPAITPADVAAVVSDVAEIPIERLLETDRERMLNLEELLADRVVGHAPALASIARVLRRNAAGLRAQRPIGSFLLLGPTGVGKTETAKAIAEALFHTADAMTRLDLSEFAESHSIARLVGAPPGYVGHEAGGQLTESVRQRPYQVILLDEIEKAHRDVLEAFLQVFDEGRMTDGRGRRVDFTNTVIVLTSNLGASEVTAARAERQVGFSRAGGGISGDKIASVMTAAAKAHLPPELWNRFDEVLTFAPLTRAEVATIAKRLLEGIAASLESRGVSLDVDPAAIEALLDAGGFDPELGARPMKRAIGRLIENPLAELILAGELPDGATAVVGVEDGAIIVDALRDQKRGGGEWGGKEPRPKARQGGPASIALR